MLSKQLSDPDRPTFVIVVEPIGSSFINISTVTEKVLEQFPGASISRIDPLDTECERIVELKHKLEQEGESIIGLDLVLESTRRKKLRLGEGMGISIPVDPEIVLTGSVRGKLIALRSNGFLPGPVVNKIYKFLKGLNVGPASIDIIS
jgi:hypothetical protein